MPPLLLLLPPRAAITTGAASGDAEAAAEDDSKRTPPAVLPRCCWRTVGSWGLATTGNGLRPTAPSPNARAESSGSSGTPANAELGRHAGRRLNEGPLALRVTAAAASELIDNELPAAAAAGARASAAGRSRAGDALPPDAAPAAAGRPPGLGGAEPGQLILSPGVSDGGGMPRYLLLLLVLTAFLPADTDGGAVAQRSRPEGPGTALTRTTLPCFCSRLRRSL